MVVADCQLDCVECVTAELRRQQPKYSLTLPQLSAFIASTQKSGYHFDRIFLNGTGEPLLWKHLEHGVSLLSKAKIADEIRISTNGLALARIPAAVLNAVVIQPGSEEATPHFARPPNTIGAVPCKCRCGGPTLYGDRIYPFCGPPGMLLPGTPWVRLLRLNYMDGAPLSSQEPRALPGCRTCWGNMNIELRECT